MQSNQEIFKECTKNGFDTMCFKIKVTEACIKECKSKFPTTTCVIQCQEKVIQKAFKNICL